MVKVTEALSLAVRRWLPRHRWVWFTATGLVLLVSLVAPLATVGDIGYQDQSFSGASAAPSGSKPESKLWWNDGLWWASMFDTVSQQFHIFRLNAGCQTWIDTGVPLDTRP